MSKEQLITVIVSMEGGVIHSVSATSPVRVLITEYDKNLNPADHPDSVIAIDNDPIWFADWRPEGDPEEQKVVSEIMKIVDQAPRCDQCGGPRVTKDWEYTEDGFIDEDPGKKLCWFCWTEAQERRERDAKLV